MKLIYNIKNSIFCKKALYGLVIFFAFLYVFSVPSFGEATSILRYLIYASMTLLGAASIIYCFLYENLRINRISLLVPLFALFSLIGTIIYSKEFRSWFSLVLLAGSFYVFVYAFKAIKNKLLVVSIISLGIFLFSLYFLFHYRTEILNFRSYGLEAFRLGSYFDNPNGVSAYAVLGVASSLFVILFGKKFVRFCFVLPLLTTLLVGITTGSKTFIVAVGVFAISLLFFRLKNHKLIFLISLGALAALGIVLINLPFLQTLKTRIIDSFQTLIGTSSKADTSTIERAVWIDYGFYLGARNVLFGFGVNGFSFYSGVGTYSHSNFAEVLCDFGLVGFILFHLPLLFILFRSLFKKGTDKSLVLPFILYYLLIGFSNVYYYKKFYFMILALLFYLSYVDNESIRTIKFVNDLKKVAFTCDSMNSGGAEKVIASISNEMANQGIKVIIIGVADYHEPSSFYDLAPGVVYQTIKGKNEKRVPVVQRLIMLRKLLSSYKPNVVISFLPNANVYTWLSLIGLRVPHIVSERNNPYIDPRSKLLRFLKRLSFIKSNGCVFQTNDAMHFYPKLVQDKSVIIKNPIELKLSSPNYPKLRNQTILAVGRLTEQKNYSCLLDAFNLFNKQNYNQYTLKIYGDGPEKNNIIDKCSKLNITQYVKMVGADNSWHEKEKFDAMYILSSDYEGMPNSLAEAMALGIPCISTDSPCGGSRELIEDGINGFLVPVGDSETLSEKMTQLVKQKDFDTFDYKSFARSYSPPIITDKWIKYIMELEEVIYE